MWIAPNPVARVSDLKFLACVALLALIIWIARRSPYAKASIFLAATVASVLIGFHEWASGKHFEFSLCALVFLSLIGSTVYGIKQIADQSTGRRAGRILDKDEGTVKHDF
jgi:glucose uptake protein GlcU